MVKHSEGWSRTEILERQFLQHGKLSGNLPDFCSIVAHDLNNRANGAVAAIEMAKDILDEGNTAEARELLILAEQSLLDIIQMAMAISDYGSMLRENP